MGKGFGPLPHPHPRSHEGTRACGCSLQERVDHGPAMVATTRATFCGSLIFFNFWRSKHGKWANGHGMTGKTGQKSATCACSFKSAVRKGYNAATRPTCGPLLILPPALKRWGPPRRHG